MGFSFDNLFSLLNNFAMNINIADILGALGGFGS